jgi:hypothetical protein
MYRLWPEESQKELRNVVIALWTAMFFAYFLVPENLTFLLFKFPLLLHPVFFVMVVCWGVFLFFQVLSLLPVGRGAKRDASNYSLLWLTLIPSISWLFWVIVALDVTFPFIDPIVEPLFLAGVITASYLFANYVSEGQLSRQLRRVAVWLQGRAVTKAKVGRGFLFQLRGRSDDNSLGKIR